MPPQASSNGSLTVPFHVFMLLHASSSGSLHRAVSRVHAFASLQDACMFYASKVSLRVPKGDLVCLSLPFACRYPTHPYLRPAHQHASIRTGKPLLRVWVLVLACSATSRFMVLQTTIPYPVPPGINIKRKYMSVRSCVPRRFVFYRTVCCSVRVGSSTHPSPWQPVLCLLCP